MRTLQRAGDAEEPGAVRHLDRLDQALARLRECGMDRQFRAGAAETALRETMGAGLPEAMAGIVDLQHEERHTQRGRPLQHGQAVRCLLERHAKARTQYVDVVAGPELSLIHI